MICQTITTPEGLTAIVCSPRQRSLCACGKRANLRCDWKVPAKKSGTCDRLICAWCATSPAPNKDLCPKHAEAFRVWAANQAPGPIDNLDPQRA